MSVEHSGDLGGSSPFQGRIDLTYIQEGIQLVKAEMGKVLVGQEELVKLMLVALLADGHILLEGVPGIAKTLAAKLLAKSLEVPFSRIQFTPDLMPSDVLGTSVFNTDSHTFEFHPGPIFSHIVLIDEINRAPAKTQAALFEAMEERQISIDGITHKLTPPFLVIATQNPIEQEGTYRLPEAQLDRFLFHIQVNYPSFDQEVEILRGAVERPKINDLSQVKAVLSAEQIIRLQEVVQRVHIEEKLMKYIVQVVQHTRSHRDLYLGASPRASLNLMLSAKALAAISGRDFVIPEDIMEVSHSVLRHRIILTPEKEMEGATHDEVLEKIIGAVEVPR